MTNLTYTAGSSGPAKNMSEVCPTYIMTVNVLNLIVGCSDFVNAYKWRADDLPRLGVKLFLKNENESEGLCDEKLMPYRPLMMMI